MRGQRVVCAMRWRPWLGQFPSVKQMPYTIVPCTIPTMEFFAYKTSETKGNCRSSAPRSKWKLFAFVFAAFFFLAFSLQRKNLFASRRFSRLPVGAGVHSSCVYNIERTGIYFWNIFIRFSLYRKLEMILFYLFTCLQLLSIISRWTMLEKAWKFDWNLSEMFDIPKVISRNFIWWT